MTGPLKSITYGGAWNPITNEPELPDAVTAKDLYFICSESASTDVSGMGDVVKGHYIVSENGKWVCRNIVRYCDSTYSDSESMKSTIPLDPATRDQMASVMLQHGTPTQQLEALRYASGQEAASPTSTAPPGWEITRLNPGSIRINNPVVGYITLYDNHMDHKLQLLYMLFDELLARQETPSAFGITSKGMDAAIEANKTIQSLKENMDKLVGYQQVITNELTNAALLQAGKQK